MLHPSSFILDRIPVTAHWSLIPMALPDTTPEAFNRRVAGLLPGHLVLEITKVAPEGLEGRLAVRPELLAPNGYLHAATVIALADTLAGYGTIANLPDGAKGFTTIELKA